MNIALISPPIEMDDETKRWIMEMFNMVSTAFENQEAEITALKKEVAALKGTP